MLDEYENRVNELIKQNGFVTYRQVLNILGFESHDVKGDADLIYWDEDGIHYGDPFAIFYQGPFPILDFNVDNFVDL